MRVAVLCGPSVRAMYVANVLCARLPVVRIVREIGREWSWPALRRALRPGALWARAGRALRRSRCRFDERNYYFADQPARFDAAELVRECAHINDPAVAADLRACAADAVAVFGTSLIRNPDLLNLAPDRMLNLHGGISPDYRGADSTFWALLAHDFTRIGCTIHRINRHIDRGDLIAHVHPRVRPGLNEEQLFGAAVRDAAPVFAEAFVRLEAGDELGRPQPPGGRLFFVRDRRGRHDRELRDQYRRGNFPPVELPPRVVWFAAPPPAPAAVTASPTATARRRLDPVRRKV